MVLMCDLLNELIRLSEKAAKLARAIREQDDLFKLLIEEKDENVKNKRFNQDFKTLTDVIIQQTIQFNLNKKFPKIDTIKGEETNKFTNANGVTIQIELKEEPNELLKSLKEIIVNENVIKLLIDIIYEDSSIVNEDDLEIINQKSVNVDLKEEDLGVWIDPIDCTNEYVNGKWESNQLNQLNAPTKFPLKGLSAVSCLIGVFLKKKGNAIIGIINLPFYHYESNRFTGKYIYGVSYKNLNFHNVKLPTEIRRSTDKLRIVLSSAENKRIIDKLKDDFELIYAAGVGFKLYLVITNQVDLFLTSKSSTFKWDICGTDAVLKSIQISSKQKRGCLFELNKLISNHSLIASYSSYELNYDTDEVANKNGLIASLDIEIIQSVLKKLKV